MTTNETTCLGKLFLWHLLKIAPKTWCITTQLMNTQCSNILLFLSLLVLSLKPAAQVLVEKIMLFAIAFATPQASASRKTGRNNTHRR